MIAAISTDYIEATFPETRSRIISVDVSAACVVTFIMLNSGDGYRPFQPLEGTVNGAPLALPVALATGTYVFHLTAEGFEGTGLMFIGYDMQNVTRISLDEPANAVTPQGSHTEYAGRPSDAVGNNADTHWDSAPKEAGGQIGYMKMGGTWRQVA